MSYTENYQKWLDFAELPAYLRDELVSMDEKTKEDAFYTNLEFGTAGMRGLIGAGTNRINIYVVRQATEGLAQLIDSKGEEAKKRGAMALFGEKYGDIVRVVTVPGFSMEFCGGVHVTNTAQIGMFKIISESSTGAGVRRIEAVTGHGAVAHVNEMEAMVKGLAASLKCRVTDVPARLTALQGELKAVEQKAAELADKIAKAQVSDVDSQIRDIKGIKALVQQVSVDDIEALRNLGDQMRDKVGGVVVLASVFADGKISILTMATKDAVAKGIHAGNIVKEVARICGGGGGGRPDMAQAGGKDASKLGEALEAAWGVIETQVK